MTINLKEFGNFLSKERENNGYKSQRQLALDAGISPATLSRIEAGTQEPKPETLKAISRFLKMTPYELLMEKAGYLNESISTNNTKKSNELEINVAYFGGAKEELTEEEAARLKEELEMFRLLKEKKLREKDNNKS
ncbi:MULTISPECIES: helix-turn-helix domain-containing protein [unclassified Paenibacillus]|uniref:helix-turn-helix domain-containing protein n=1 Tax=unclassified Paenibacillus TaxID=185978 RepID=UPI0036343DB9